MVLPDKTGKWSVWPLGTPAPVGTGSSPRGRTQGGTPWPQLLPSSVRELSPLSGSLGWCSVSLRPFPPFWLSSPTGKSGRSSGGHPSPAWGTRPEGIWGSPVPFLPWWGSPIERGEKEAPTLLAPRCKGCFGALASLDPTHNWPLMELLFPGAAALDGNLPRGECLLEACGRSWQTPSSERTHPP